jgi:protocatechuate 4,5-dioxygenase alpha chain
MSSTDRYYLNKLFYDTQRGERLAAYRQDPGAFLDGYRLSPGVRAAVESNDIGAMYRAGANPYLLRYYCVNMQVPEPEFLGALAALREPKTEEAEGG